MANLKENNIKKLQKMGYQEKTTEDLLKTVSKNQPKFVGGTNVSNVWWIHLKDSNNNDLEDALVKEYIKYYGN